MKRATLIILLVLTILGKASSQQAKNISESQALQTAKAFVNSQSSFQNADLQLVSASDLFIYNVGDQGFVIISGNTVLSPIIGWSDQGNFPDMDEAPENFRSWIEHYGEMIDYAVSNGISPDPKVQQQWDDIERGIFSKSESAVNPLVSTYWNQDCYYNEYCPEAPGYGWGGWGGGPCGHAYAGCVACAMAQVMKYWNHPTTGFGEHSYTHSEYGQQSANFGATTYHWDDMPNEVWNSNDAVATLMYHCGVSVDMNYGPSGSGAYSADVETAFRSYFGYCGAKYRLKSSYSEEAWIAMLKSDLDQSRPIYYSGSNGDSGHAFVCDGYDNSDRMHFNFGWSGSGDGYYTVSDVNGFNQGQGVVMNIIPMNIQADDHGIIYVTTDGEGDGSSWANATNKLEYAVALCSNNTMVWVKQGTYYGDTTDVEGAFFVAAGNRIYGSFNGDETPDYNLTQRDFVNHASILDGQGARRVLNQDQAFTAATIALWDGFTIQNGAIGSGSGAYLNNYVTMTNCTVRNNTATMYGGGIYINSTGGTARVTLDNCIITDNIASMGGGVCDRIGADYTNCRISNNTATTKGGGIYLYMNTEPTLKNCILSNNSAKDGGAMYARGRFTAYNCDIVMNQATESIGGIFNEEHHNKYYNCIIWGNEANGQPSQMDGVSDFEYCAVQGGVDGTEIIDLLADNDGEGFGSLVRFNQPAEGVGADYHDADWSLQSGSICLNAGKPNTTGAGSTDIEGNPRVQKGRIEIGASESCAALNAIDVATCDTYYPFNGQELTEDGFYGAILTGADCDSVVKLTLTFLDSPKVAIEGPDTVYSGGSVTLIATGADSYLWSTGETTESITVSPTQNTTYSVIGTNANGCTDEASFEVTVTQGCNEMTEPTVRVWPNPTTGLLHIEGEGIASIEVMNLVGQLVRRLEATETLDMSAFEKGVYLLIVSDENGAKGVTKIVKE